MIISVININNDRDVVLYSILKDDIHGQETLTKHKDGDENHKNGRN